MSGKLDQSLDEILSTRRNTARGRPVRRGTRTRAVAAPVGGVQKNTKTVAKTTTKGAAAAAGGLDSKIIVSNLVRSCPCSLRDPQLTKSSPPMWMMA